MTYGRFFDVVRVLFDRLLKVRYRGSVLGILWSAANPLATATVYTVIFGHTFAPYYGNSLVRYAAAVYLGLALIGFFISSTNQALPSIVQNGDLLNKVRIPFEAFPIAALAANGFQQLVATLPLIVVMALVAGHNVLGLIILIVPIAGLVMFSAGVALFVSAAHVYFRDVPYLYEIATFLLWLTSPVFYPAAIVPPRVLHVFAFNPLFPMLESVRQLVLTNTIPPAWMLGVAFLDGAVVLVLGHLAFRAMRPQFMDLL